MNDADAKISAVRGWGSTVAERAARYPCDNVLPGAVASVHRGIDIDAPSALAFRWLCQLRVAPYSYDLLDNLGRRSPRTLTPGLEQLRFGQTFMMIYALAGFEHDREITLASRSLVRVFGRQAITYRVSPRGDAGTRLVVKRCLRPPRGPIGQLIRLTLPFIDLIMTRKQLRTLKRLAEEQARKAG